MRNYNQELRCASCSLIFEASVNKCTGLVYSDVQLRNNLSFKIRNWDIIRKAPVTVFITSIATVACICTNLSGSGPQLVMNEKAYKFFSSFITMKFITVQKSHTTLVGQFT